MSRQTCQAYELTDDTYVFHNGTVEKIVKAHTVVDRTTIINDLGEAWRISSSTTVELASQAEVVEYQQVRDRIAVADALRSLGDRIVSRGLPVPAGGRGIVVSLYLADDADLEPWADYLSSRPQRGTVQPLIQADAEGVEINVYGPGNSGEFGPDLADAPAESVEHRVSVGAFPIVGKPCAKCGAVDALSPIELCHDCEVELALKDIAEMRAAENAPERDGWSVSDGHRPPVDDEAMQHDRHSGEG